MKSHFSILTAANKLSVVLVACPAPRPLGSFALLLVNALLVAYNFIPSHGRQSNLTVTHFTIFIRPLISSWFSANVRSLVPLLPPMTHFPRALSPAKNRCIEIENVFGSSETKRNKHNLIESARAARKRSQCGRTLLVGKWKKIFFFVSKNINLTQHLGRTRHGYRLTEERSVSASRSSANNNNRLPLLNINIRPI